MPDDHPPSTPPRPKPRRRTPQSSTIQPSTIRPSATQPSPPKRSPVFGARRADAPVGLALGGGVARGWAHIGVLRRLEELGVVPDIVCGTSVGALAGGFWLAGKLDPLEEWARRFTRRSMLSYIDVVLNGSGLVGGKRLRRTMDEQIGDVRIEDLPKPFIAVTAELVTGHEIWLRDGPLAAAIEAAYALPGVFPPRLVDGRWLIDGALVNPMPVSVARAMGARCVIAVGLHADAFGRASVSRRERFENFDDLASPDERSNLARLTDAVLLRRLFGSSGAAPGLGSTLLASFNIVMDRITRSRLAGDPPDVQILPAAGHVGLLEFDRADELIAIGRAAVDDAAPQLEAAIKTLG
ncbi:MAG: patatin-like phospholipase family protein [Parvularculaceae bacterium]